MSDDVRVSTGNPEADKILGGGFVANSINIVMGEPGTGKTVFAEQLVFHNADGGHPVLYLTTLSEPLSKVVTYLQRFAFYDEEKLGTSIIYDDLGSALAAGGPEVLVPHIRRAIETLGPRILVIDSFKAIHDLSPGMSVMRRMAAELAGLLSAFETTTFLVGEYCSDDVARLPEFAIADGIVEFARHERSNVDERFIRVSKLRGSSYLEGLHAIHITSNGLEVYPRLVSPAAPEGYTGDWERMPTGVPGLDPLVGGGVWRGSSTLVVGPTGSGKTTLGLQFALSAVAEGRSALYVNFQENPTQLRRVLDRLSPQTAAADHPGLHLLYASSVELQIDRIIVEIFRLVETHGIRRVVIDAVGDLAMAAADAQRTHNFLYALVQRFAASGITVMFALEDIMHGPLEMPPGPTEFGRLSYMCDNLILLEIERGDRLRRWLTVYKTRASAHDDESHPMTIGEAGVRVE
jgi:circadian clock protein KaiC